MSARAGIVALAAAVLTYLAMWALLFVVCLFDAEGDSSSLPPPNSWTLRAVHLAVAILVGLLTFRAFRDWALRAPDRPAGDWGPSRQAAVSAGLALVAVLVVSGSMHAYGVSREHKYLNYLPPGMSREAGLAYGHQACDWLAAQPWGKPSGQIPPRPQARSTVVLTVPFRTVSTNELAARYVNHLDAQHPGPLTQNERQQASVIGSAWFELCPFQQWVHRPVGGSS